MSLLYRAAMTDAVIKSIELCGGEAREKEILKLANQEFGRGVNSLEMGMFLSAMVRQGFLIENQVDGWEARYRLPPHKC